MFAFDPCISCRHPIHCRTVQQCCISVEPAIAPELPARAGPPHPTKRGGATFVDPDYSAIEHRILAKMAAIDGAACYVVAKFHELTKTESGTPLFTLKTADGSLAPTANLLRNLVVEAIQGEVTLS